MLISELECRCFCLLVYVSPGMLCGCRYYVQMVAWYREQHEAAKEAAEIASIAVPEMAAPPATTHSSNASMPSPMPTHPATEPEQRPQPAAVATPVSHPVTTVTPAPAR